jgi:hypothetical protein
MQHGTSLEAIEMLRVRPPGRQSGATKGAKCGANGVARRSITEQIHAPAALQHVAYNRCAPFAAHLLV